MVQTPVSIGIVGAGIMGERMLAAILDQDSGAVRVGGLWDPSPAAIARVAASRPGIPLCPSAAAVIEACECLYVASPPASHLGYARAALAAGRTVFCEKPLAVDLPDARAFVAAAAGRGAVNFPFASSLGVATLTRWMDEGAVGRPTGLRIEVAFATWPRAWQADAAGWLDRRPEGGSPARWSRISCFSADGSWDRSAGCRRRSRSRRPAGRSGGSRPGCWPAPCR